MDGDLSITSGPVRLRVDGYRRTLRALEAAGADAENMRDLMHELGNIIVRDAKQRVPTESGKLGRTLRAGRGKTKAVVRAGSKAVPYAGIIHYGTPASYPKQYASSPYIVEALQSQQAAVLRKLIDGLEDLLKNNNLK